MAGLIAALFGGKSRQPVETNPLPGIGGYQLPPGPAGQTGFPGSTSQTRTNRGLNPRAALVRSDTNTGFEQSLSNTIQSRQSSYRGDTQDPIAAPQSPRATPGVQTRQPVLTEQMQQVPGEFYGGPMLHTGQRNNTAGGQPGRGAIAAGGHGQRETTTPWIDAQPNISGNVPGSQNVRNTKAVRYQNPAGQMHTYKSAYRADQTPVLPKGQNADGNVKADLGVTEVTVPNRFVFDDGGNQSWSVLRDMPYGQKGNGKRGASLSGQRYYATGQSTQFWNAGQGDYGIAREQGSDHKYPVSFDKPAPWTANYYMTTDQVQAQSTGQSPTNVYVSANEGRAGNATGRRA